MKPGTRLVPAALLALALFSTFDSAAQSTPERPAQRIILKWRGIERVQESSEARQALDRATARIGVSARPLRLLATGAELFELDQPVTDAQLKDLLATLGADSHVEYVELDATMKHFRTPPDVR